MKRIASLAASAVLAGLASTAFAEVKVATERGQSGFRFQNIPRPSPADAATRAKATIVDGEQDPNGGDANRLHDGRLPRSEDQPAANFFFAPGLDGGRLAIDLGTNVTIRQVNTYSWHAGDRGPQVYKVYASTGSDFNPAPRRGTDPQSCGWKLVAAVDTRPAAPPRMMPVA